MAFTSGGQVFHFPRTNTCQVGGWRGAQAGEQRGCRRMRRCRRKLCAPAATTALLSPSPRTWQTVYCNAEGVQWIDDRRIIVTSDKAKGYQVGGWLAGECRWERKGRGEFRQAAGGRRQGEPALSKTALLTATSRPA